MRNQLLGYLMGALEPDEQRAVEIELDRNPELRRELAALGEGLELLEVDDEYQAPPPGLAARTCRFVQERAVSVARPAPQPSGWQLQDMFVAAGVLMAASMLFFPAVNQSRSMARRAACEHNLRTVGMGLLQYGEFHAGFLPYVPLEGKLAVAGVYAPTLRETGIVEDENVFRCPADPEGARGREIPLRCEVLEASGDRLRALQRRMGGSYAYVVGFVQDGKYRGQQMLPQRKGRFPLLADAPACSIRGLPSQYHDGSGQNVFFDDGHVEFLTECTDCVTDDNIYVNAMGVVGAGVDMNDAVLGGSDARVGIFD